MGRALLFLDRQLCRVEFGPIINTSPIMRGVEHLHTGHQGPVQADDDGEYTGPAWPRRQSVPDETLHGQKMGNGVDHVVAGSVFFNQPINKTVHLGDLIPGYPNAVPIVIAGVMFGNRGFVDVVIYADGVIIRDFG